MRTLVIGDVHGRHDLLAALLDQEEVPVSAEERAKQGVRAVQVGDLVNCVREREDDDLATIALARRRVDRVLLGNHEAPYFDRMPGFSGFHRYRRVGEALLRLRDDGLLVTHLVVGGTLVTHAGVAAGWNVKTATEAVAKIEGSSFEPSPIIGQVGSARSSQHAPPFGGILWSDWSERRAPFQQVHGHTPIRDGNESFVQNGNPGVWALNIDVGASWEWGPRRRVDRLRGVWLNEDGSILRVVDLA